MARTLHRCLPLAKTRRLRQARRNEVQPPHDPTSAVISQGAGVTRGARLIQLHRDIDARVAAVREGRPEWLCRKGCDHCCTRLADVPTLTAPEWHLLREGLAALAPARLEQIRTAMAGLAGATTRPVVCPLLDRVAGACLVYMHRPVACRTYGFFVQRALGLYCDDIEASVSRGELADVVWGNHDAIDQHLSELGEKRSLPAWFQDWVDLR